MTANLAKGQAIVLSAAALPMIAVGAFGGTGTYSNIVEEFDRAATAIGVVAAGEGVTLVLALVMVGVTMLGQAAPAPVGLGLWAAPIGAGLTGVVVADDYTEAVVYGMTPPWPCPPPPKASGSSPAGSSSTPPASTWKPSAATPPPCSASPTTRPEP